MHTYAKLQDGRIMIVYSDNTQEETMDLMPIGYDSTVDVAETVPYSYVVNIDSNRSIL